MSAPLVTVVIPTYNLKTYLSEALDSVLNQTFQDFEIVVVDDGSSDGTRSIILEYVKTHPEKVRPFFQENRGAAAARNKGAEMAAGRWLAFLDGDDVWKPEKLERQLEAANDDSELNFLSTLVEVFGKEGELWNQPPTIPDLKYELLINGCFITLSTVLIRKDLFLSEKFDELLDAAHDIELFVRLADKSKHHFLNEPLAYHRVREESISDLWKTRYIQVSNHYRLVEREVKRLKRSSDARSSNYMPQLRKVMRDLSHDAAYSSLFSRQAGIGDRLASAFTAIAEHPAGLKNYRFLLQSFLPRSINAWFLKQRIHGQ